MRWKSDSSGKLHTNADCLSRFPLTSSDTNDEEICVTIGVQNSVNNELFTSEDLDELTAKQKNNHLCGNIITNLENNRSVGRRYFLKMGHHSKLNVLGVRHIFACVFLQKTLILF
jgi:hypothetical protein